MLRRIAVALVLLAPAACGGSTPHHLAPAPPTSRTVPTTSADPLPTPSRTGPLTTGPNVRPGETPPVPPAMTHDNLGALTFATYFFRAYDWSLATNDAYLLRRISAGACEACKRLIANIDALSMHHQVLHGGRISVESAGVAQGVFEIRSDYTLEAHTVQQSLWITDSSGRRVSEAKGEAEASLVYLNWIRFSWQVREVGTGP